jgi:mRNA deadenylase 3'-5' endonuclease subunit Ccr4
VRLGAKEPDFGSLHSLSLTLSEDAKRYVAEGVSGRGEPITSHFSKFTGTLDYLFLTEDWHVSKYLQLPGRSALFSLGGLPTPEWPSDHLVLCAELNLM